MRRCLYLPSILLLLTLCVELCAVYGSGVVKDPSKLVCLLDDDDVELKEGVLREQSFPDCAALPLSGPFVVACRIGTDLVTVVKEVEISQIHLGVRRHRWLCRESC